MENSWSDGVCQSVSQYVCSSIFVNSAWTAGPIGTGEAPIDAHIRRNHDGAGPVSISDTWHVARAAARRPGKSCSRPYRSNGGHHRAQTRKAHAYYPNLCAFGVAVPVGCQLHAPGAKKFFDVGSSGLKKL